MLDQLDHSAPINGTHGHLASALSPSLMLTPSMPGRDDGDASDRAIADWRQELGCGDIVLFAFPIRMPGETEGPKTRPCLVLDVVEMHGHQFALLAYGTSTATAASKSYEITVATAAEVAASGLKRYTRFVGGQRLLVSLDHSDFRLRPSTGSPVVGRLGPIAMKRLHQVRGRIHAEADMAAERRAQARREREDCEAGGRGWPTRRLPSRPVAVQRRPSRHVRVHDTTCRHDQSHPVERPAPRVAGRLGLATSTPSNGAAS